MKYTSDRAPSRSAVRLFGKVLRVAPFLLLHGCGGGHSGGSAATYTVGGSLNGLTAGGLVLANGGDTVAPDAAATSFTFAKALASGATYAVVVQTQPTGETCTVSNGSGTLGASNVTNVQVSCVADATFTIGGSITGLTAGGLTLVDNATDTISPPANATTFVFTKALAAGAGYSVTVKNQPSGESCTVAGGSGTVAAANITSVNVTCTGTAAMSIAGTAIEGMVAGATVTAYSVNADASNGASLGSATSADDGTFAITLTSVPTGVVRVAVSGGSYSSEANTATTVNGVTLTGLIPTVPSTGATGIVITPLTTFSDQRAVALLAAGGQASISAASTAADKNVKAIYGIQDQATPLTALGPNFTSASGDAAAIALALGSLEQLALQVAKPPQAVVSALAADLTDGVLNGKTASGAAIKYVSSDTMPAPTTLGNTLFLNAITAYTAASNTATIAAVNKVAFSAATISAIRSGVVANSPTSAGLDTNSSGAITSLTYADASNATHQIVYFAANTDGLQAIDVTNPAALTTVDLSALNKALSGGSSPLFTTVDGVIAVPVSSGDPQLLLFSYNSATLALVDPITGTLVTSMALPIASPLDCSGASPYVSGGLIDTVAATPTVWLTTGVGYLPITIAGSTITAGAAVSPPNSIGMPENVGGSVLDRILFAASYCTLVGGGTSPNANPGLVLVNLDTQHAFSLDSADYLNGLGGLGEPDSGAVDSAWKVGLTVDEHSQTFSFIDLRGLSNAANYTFDVTASAFTPATPGTQLKSITLTDPGFPSMSGVNVNSSTHLAFLWEELGADSLGVALLDNPANPASATAGWAGFNGFRWENGASSTTGSPTTYCSDGDPHSQATISHFANGRTYGFALNVCDTRTGTTPSSGAIVLDMQNFLAAPAQSGSSQLANNPFADPTIVQMVKF